MALRNTNGSKRVQVQVFHNILWASYKGAVFTKLHEAASGSSIEIKFVQIAETDRNRVKLGPPNLALHRYPYELLFKGSYGNISAFRRAFAVGRSQLRARAQVIVINSYDDLSAWTLLLVAKLLRQKVVVSLDSTYLDHPRVWYKEALKRFFIAKCDRAFCYGTRSREYLEFLGMPRERIAIRCQAAPMEEILAIKQSVLDAGWLQRSGSPRPYFLYVGRLSHEKGLFLLLDAFKGVAMEFEYDLLIVGAGELRQPLEQRAAGEGLAGRVKFLESKKMNELVRIYMEAFYLVLPSTSEPWGLVVNEAFAMNCPAIVSSNCGCAPDLITADTGLVFENGNSLDLLAKLRESIRKFEERDRMGQAALRHIETYTPAFAAAQMLEGLLQLAR